MKTEQVCEDEAEEDGLANRMVVVAGDIKKKENLVIREREFALEKLMQQQTHRLCQEPFWNRSSASTFSDRGTLTSSVF